MQLDRKLARRVALILGMSFASLSFALADGRVVLPPEPMVMAYVSGAPDITRDMLWMSMIPGAMGVAMHHGAGGGATPSWNPSDRSIGIALTNSNLTAAADSSGGPRGVRGFFRSFGKLYFEVQIINPDDVDVGIASDGAEPSVRMGVDNSFGVIYYTNGFIVANTGAVFLTVNGFVAGDIVSVAVDINNRLAYFAKNGGWQNSANPATGTGAVNYATAPPVAPFFRTRSNGASVTLNVGSTAFAYSPPSGFSAWG